MAVGRGDVAVGSTHSVDLPLRFNLRTLLLGVAIVAVVLAPFHWFGSAYLVSAVFSASLVIACVLAYRSQQPAFSLAVAGGGALIGFFLAIGLLIYFLHALVNLLVCGVLLSAKVRPRTFGLGLVAAAAVVYAHSFWNGAAAIRKLAALKLRHPFESLDERLSFERNLKPARSDDNNGTSLSRRVTANLYNFDGHLEERYFRRTWALRELHEETNRHFTRAAGFGFMRMPSVSEYVLRLEPRPELNMPLAVDLTTPKPTRSELFGKHQAAVLDFVEPDRLGYVKPQRRAAGFEAHGFASLPEQLSGDDRKAQWQIARLELVSLLRHDEPRVYIAATLPQMDQLDDVPHRPLNAFEDGALPKLISSKDLVLDSQPKRIQMLGSIRAASKCIECHEGPRGKLLGAFSYEIMPLAMND
jgi:hypothetical protein